MRIDVLLLGVPKPYSGELRERARRIDAPSIISEHSRAQDHLTFRVIEKIVPVARLFDCVYREVQRWPPARARNTLWRMKYRADPRCVIAHCERDVCQRVCGHDLWRTPHYWDAVKDARDGDCDDIELLVGGLRAGGIPLFVRPHGADQGHVMHLPVKRGKTALDYCIPAGMRRWKGPRNCFFFDNDALIEGVIRHDGREAPNVFQCQW